MDRATYEQLDRIEELLETINDDNQLIKQKLGVELDDEDDLSDEEDNKVDF